MLHEEFTTLSGVTVSHKFYTENIEPQYMNNETWKTGSNDGSDKRAFCTWWLKDNKASICKASTGDILALSRIAAVSDATQSTNANLKSENTELKQRAEISRKNFELEKTRRECCEKSISQLENTIAQKDFEIEEFKKFANAEIRKLQNEKSETENQLSKAEYEIMRLKSQLYDLHYKTA